MIKETGGNAYPQNTVYLAPNGQAMQQGPQGGMNLRDYFAAKAMQGYCSDNEWTSTTNQDETARCAYEMADAMLEARK